MSRLPGLRLASLGGATVFALVLVSGAEVSAQSAIEEVTVTARKREETLQQIPLSITAITAMEIQNRGVKSIRDVVNLTPGLSMSEFGAGTLNFPVIRGMTNLTAGSFAENNVSVFYNGVYLLSSNIVDATFLDVDRIEVVKGPNENNLSVLRRFTKRVQGSGIIPRVRSLRYNQRVLSHYKNKMKTLEGIKNRAERNELMKQGKIVEEKKRGR